MTTRDLDRLGEAIRTTRELLELTQDQVAERGGPSDVTLRGLENGLGKKPNGDTLRKLDIGLGWPRGAAAKILRGAADVVVSGDSESGPIPFVLDYEEAQAMMPPADVQAELNERDAQRFDLEQANQWSERPIYEQSTSDLLIELTGRFRDQDKRIRRLEDERSALQGRIAELLATQSASPAPSPLIPDGDHVGEWAETDAQHEEQWKAGAESDPGFGLAAKASHSKLEQVDREAGERGEESQDSGTDEPA